MATYGYRLFTVQVMDGHKRRALNFKDCGGEHYTDIVARLLKGLTAKTMVGDPPSDLTLGPVTVANEEEAIQKGYVDQAAFRVEEVQTAARTVRATVWAGKFGSHERALGAGDATEDADISDKAASRQYRLVLALPDNGTTGILAVEDISRGCPVTPIVRWLRWSSQEEAVSTSSENNKTWWRTSVKPLADEARFMEMIRSGQAQKLELVKHRVTASRTRENEVFRVSAPLVEDGKISQVAQVVQGWVRRQGGEVEDPESIPKMTDADAAKQLAAIVGPDIADLDLDDGWVVLDDTDGRNKRVSPSRMSEIFVYRQSGRGKNDTPRFYADVRARALRLQESIKLNLDWPSH